MSTLALVGLLVGFIIVYILTLVSCYRDIKANDSSVPSRRDLNELDGIIDQLDRDGVEATNLHSMLRAVMTQVLSDQPGHGASGRIPIAMQPLELAVDAKVRARREWSGMFIMITLLMTAIVLALVFYGRATKGEILSHFSLVFTANALALTTAVVLHGMYLRAKTEADSILARVYAALGRLREDATQDLDSELVKAVEIIARKIEKRSEAFENRNLERVEELIGEVKVLGVAIQDMFREVVSPDSTDDEEEESAILIARSVGAAVERLSTRVDEASAALVKAVEEGTPAMTALDRAAGRVEESQAALVKADIPGRIDSFQEQFRALNDGVAKLPRQMAEAQESGLLRLQDVAKSLGQKLEELKESSTVSEEVLARAAATALLPELKESLHQVENTLVNKYGSALEGQTEALTLQLQRLSAEISQSIADASGPPENGGSVEAAIETTRHDVLRQLGEMSRLISTLPEGFGRSVSATQPISDEAQASGPQAPWWKRKFGS